MPNQYLLLATLSLQEAKESSEIENIVTTQDDLYRSHYRSQQFLSTSAKEVHNYAQALETGFNTIKSTDLLNALIYPSDLKKHSSAGILDLRGQVRWK